MERSAMKDLMECSSLLEILGFLTDCFSALRFAMTSQVTHQDLFTEDPILYSPQAYYE
jgi:hypothetical protein